MKALFVKIAGADRKINLAGGQLIAELLHIGFLNGKMNARIFCMKRRNARCEQAAHPKRGCTDAHRAGLQPHQV